jgi:plasmid stability protein
MTQLLVRNLSEDIPRQLKIQAALHGVSAEEEHRRILEAALLRAAPESLVLREDSPPYRFRTLDLGDREPSGLPSSLDFKAHLLALGEVAPDVDLERPRTFSKRRNIEL